MSHGYSIEAQSIEKVKASTTVPFWLPEDMKLVLSSISAFRYDAMLPDIAKALSHTTSESHQLTDSICFLLRGHLVNSYLFCHLLSDHLPFWEPSLALF